MDQGVIRAGVARAFRCVYSHRTAQRARPHSARPALTPEPLEGRVFLSTTPTSAVVAPSATGPSVAAAPLVSAAAVVMPTIPNSDNWYGTIVNANNYITSPYYMPNISPDLNMITDLTGTSAQTWAEAVTTVQTAHPDMLIGTYHSMRDAQLANTFTNYPRRAVPREGLSSSQILMKDPGNPNVDIVNYTQTAARRYLVNNVVQDVVNTGSGLAFLDNVSHSESGFPISWKTTTDVVREMSTNLHTRGKRVVVNAAWVPGVTTMTSVDQFIATGADGVSLEMGFHANVRGSVTRIKTAITQYRKMLDRGIAVIFIPLGSATGGADTIENIEVEQRLQAAYGMMFRKPGDKLFTNQIFWRPVPEWTQWPTQFGAALGEATITTNAAGQVTMTRQFTNYTLTANVATKEVVATARVAAAAAPASVQQAAPAPTAFSAAPATQPDAATITGQVLGQSRLGWRAPSRAPALAPAAA